MPQEISTSDAAVASAPTRQLTLYDSTCIIVGIIIGVAIFRSSPVIASLLPNAAWLVGVWILGGVLSLIGALCYAELANAYPQCGGDYVYLTRAYGRPLGFLFAWSQLWVVRPGSIGAMAFAFADYANQIWPCAVGPSKPAVLLAYAVGSIVVLTGINILGVREGKWTQNLLTTVKVLGLGVILIVGFCYSGPQSPPAVAAVAAKPETLSLAAFLDKFGLAMIFVLFAYGGWNEMAYVAAEVKNPRKHPPRYDSGDCGRGRHLRAGESVLRPCAGISGSPSRDGRRGRAPIACREVGGPGDQSVDCDLGIGCNQRADLYRSPDLLCDGNRASPLLLARSLEPAFGHARAFPDHPVVDHAGAGRRLRHDRGRFRVHGQVYNSGLLDLPRAGWSCRVRPALPGAADGSSLPRPSVPNHADPLRTFQRLHGLRQPQLRDPQW